MMSEKGSIKSPNSTSKAKRSAHEVKSRNASYEVYLEFHSCKPEQTLFINLFRKGILNDDVCAQFWNEESFLILKTWVMLELKNEKVTTFFEEP